MENRGKPVKLWILITAIFVMGVIAFLFPGSVFTSTRYALAISVGCFFTALLCAINHNSGRYCTIVLSLVLIGFCIFDTVGMRDELEQLSAHQERVYLGVILAPIASVMISTSMLILVFSKSVSEHFDAYMEAELSVKNSE